MGILGADDVLARPQTHQKSTAEAKRQAEATTLRKRLAKSKSSDRNFWRDVKRLEALGPMDVKIAVIRHLGGTVVYSYKNVAGLAVADGHIVLGPFGLVQAEQAVLRGDVPPSAAFAVVTRERADWWPNGIVPFEVAPELETAIPGAVDAVIAEYERLTPVRFQPRNGAQRYVRFVKQLPFFSSMTDHIGRSGGENQVKIQTDGSDGELQRVVIDRSLRHELGHALGMYHEHNRKDRDDFVRIDQDCIDLGTASRETFRSSKKARPSVRMTSNRSCIIRRVLAKRACLGSGAPVSTWSSEQRFAIRATIPGRSILPSC
ncbi:MAG: M12 family metallopeptidase [Casimicrobiaceae bacterium]